MYLRISILRAPLIYIFIALGTVSKSPHAFTGNIQDIFEKLRNQKIHFEHT